MHKTLIVFAALAALGVAGGAEAKTEGAPQQCKTSYQNCQSVCFASRDHGSCFAGCTARYNHCAAQGGGQ
jgi:hypothetical protein